MMPEQQTPSRRVVLGSIAAATVIATSPAAAATGATTWRAVDWLDRWGRLGCGAHLDSYGYVRLTPRHGVEDAAGAMLGDIAAPGRVEALRRALTAMDDGCSAMRACDQIDQIDREFVSEDDDPAGHSAWLDRWEDAYERLERLERIPAKSGRGLAAKLRKGLEGNGSDAGNRIIASALAQLERWA